MYTPMAPGNYLIGVKYGGPNHIVGSPFKAKVTGNQIPLKLPPHTHSFVKISTELLDRRNCG